MLQPDSAGRTQHHSAGAPRAGKMLLPALCLLLSARCLLEPPGASLHGVGAAHTRRQRSPGEASAGVAPVRGRRAAGQRQGAAYLKLNPVGAAALDAVETQQLLNGLRLPKDTTDGAATITALTLTTECGRAEWGARSCRCLPGHLWRDALCRRLEGCGGGLLQAFLAPLLAPPCDCLRWTDAEPGYCVPLLDAATVSGSTRLPPRTAGADGPLSLSFSLPGGATAVKAFLLGSRGAKELRNGTRVALLLLRGGAETLLDLHISAVSPDWAGDFICRYWSEGGLWEQRQRVTIPLLPVDVVRTPSRVPMNCSSPDKVTLQCCVRNRVQAGVLASWSPPRGEPVLLLGNSDVLCHFLALDSCPGGDTAYQCLFESSDAGSIQTTILVTVIQAGDLVCPAELAGGQWNATRAGQGAEILCPEGKDGRMLRNCSSQGTWGGVQSTCTKQQLLAGLQEAKLLQAGLGNPHTEVPWMLDWLKVETEPGDTRGNDAQDFLGVLLVMDTISQVALNAHMYLDTSDVVNLLAAANELLDLDPEEEWAAMEALWPPARSSFLQALEDLTSLLVPPLGGFNCSLPNIELQSIQFGPGSVAEFSVAFETEPPLSAHITEEALDALVSQGQNITIVSSVLKKAGNVLPGRLGSLLMTHAIMSPNGSVRQIEIGMTFGLWNATQATAEGEQLVPQCVFWNHSLLDGLGGWSAEGCQTSGTEAATNCSCLHLTSFSVLMAAHPVPSSFALTFLSKFGTCASILALVATLVIYYLIWTSVVKNKVAYFRYTTLANIAFSLLTGNIWFLAATQMTADREDNLCVATAFFIHFSYLAMFFWMLVQALMLFHQLIFVFHRLAIHSVLPAMILLGYLCPFLIAVATVAVLLPRKGYLQEALCWLSAQSKAIYAFSVPVLAIVVVNVLILFVVLLKLMRPSVSEGAQREEWKALLGIFKALLVLTPVFGVTWALGVITMTTEASVVAHYAFTILNSFQGVFILLCGCLMDKKVREALRRRLQKTPSAGAATSESKSETLESKLSS